MAAVELCKALRDGRDTTNIPNIWANVDGTIYENTPSPLTQDLDWLPYPDVRDDNKFYIEKNSYTIEEPWKRTAEYRIYFSEVVRTTVLIATSRFLEMSTTRRARSSIVLDRWITSWVS